MNNQNNGSELNRRDFIGSFSSLMMLMGGVAITRPQEKKEGETKERYAGPPLNCAVIGCGQWGREILSNLSRVPRSQITAICDSYPAYLKRASSSAPKAAKVENYRQILDNKDIHAVIIATPTHLHKQ